MPYTPIAATVRTRAAITARPSHRRGEGAVTAGLLSHTGTETGLLAAEGKVAKRSGGTVCGGANVRCPIGSIGSVGTLLWDCGDRKPAGMLRTPDGPLTAPGG